HRAGRSHRAIRAQSGALDLLVNGCKREPLRHPNPVRSASTPRHAETKPIPSYLAASDRRGAGAAK
ncbi:hypothetical protein K2X89_06230, partial [Myxococcota bacterium]|nr:hypothetical protein [Myxococcota bacterium]